MILNYVLLIEFTRRFPMGCHKEDVRDLRKIAREAIPKGDHSGDVSLEPMECSQHGCRNYTNPICTEGYCSEHHVEICHKLMSAVKTELECDIRQGTGTEGSQARITSRNGKRHQRPSK